MASYQAKIGWKMPGKREYKKYRSVLFLPDACCAPIRGLLVYGQTNQPANRTAFKSRPTQASIRFFLAKIIPIPRYSSVDSAPISIQPNDGRALLKEKPYKKTSVIILT